jgi:purine-binding chemotaxis protein CheW
MEKFSGLIVYQVSDKEFCAELNDISAIIKVSEILPRASLGESLQPFIIFDNEKIPIVDLHRFFGYKFEEPSEDTRILLVEIGERKIGVFVEKVIEIISIDRVIGPSLEFSPNDQTKFLLGTFKYEERIIFLPDFKEIIADFEQTHQTLS